MRFIKHICQVVAQCRDIDRFVQIRYTVEKNERFASALYNANKEAMPTKRQCQQRGNANAFGIKRGAVEMTEHQKQIHMKVFVMGEFRAMIK